MAINPGDQFPQLAETCAQNAFIIPDETELIDLHTERVTRNLHRALKALETEPFVQSETPGVESSNAVSEVKPGATDLDDIFDNAPKSAQVMQNITIVTSKDKHPGDRHFGRRVFLGAKRLNTRGYLESKIIDESDLNCEGIYTDNIDKYATHILVRNGSKVATARLIPCRQSLMPGVKKGLMTLPTAEHFSVDPDQLARVAGVERLVDLKDGDAAEVSMLVAEEISGAQSNEGGKYDAVIALYTKMLAMSLEKGHKVWLMNIEPGFTRMLQYMLGKEHVHVLGGLIPYKGAPTQPVAVNTLDIARALLTTDNTRRKGYAEHLRACLKGVNDRNIPEDIKNLLAPKTLRHDALPVRVGKNVLSPEFAFGALVCAYSAARVIPASNVEQFHGDPHLLMGIDIASSFPYSWGMTKLYSAKSLGGKAIGALVAAPMFALPYWYFYSKSKAEYPPVVNEIAAFIAGTAAVKAVFDYENRIQREVKLREALVSTHS